ncbi:MAG: dTDP-4-dehydrorhamnose reductase [Bacteroidales bacterium]|nr:dTDP-4-dehydrorhamnose reductase [Bacteroidales bacterium]
MKILVTGAGGQLGSEIRHCEHKPEDTYFFTDIRRTGEDPTDILDITDPTAVCDYVESHGIDLVLNCAAYTNVEKAEDDYINANALNNKAVTNLANACRNRGAMLIHISTDYVFKGTDNTPCSELTPPEPNGVYGITKLMGEKSIQMSGCRWMIVRTAWLYSTTGTNFVKTMLRLTAEKESINVVFDQVGTPTYAADLAEFLCGVINSRQLDNTGIYHFTDEGVCSWYDFACAINDLSGHHCDVRPCYTSEFPSKVQRPHYSVMDKTKVKKTFGIRIPHWYHSLKKCLEKMSL